MPRSLRSLAALVLSLAAILAVAAPAGAQTPPEQSDTPVGGLQQLPDPNDCISTQGGDPAECGTVIAGGTTDAVSIAVSPDGKNAYVASSGGENPGSLATFTRNISTGELSFNSCFVSDASPETCTTELTQLQGASSVVVTPNNNFVYVASSTSDAIRGFSRNTTTGALTPLAGPDGCIQEIGAGGCGEGDGINGVEYLVLAPNGEFLYAMSSEQGTIAIFDIDPADGSIAQDEDNFVSQTGVRAGDISPDGADLYAVSPDESVLVKYDRDNSTGALTRDQCFRGTTSTPLACGAPQGTTNGINGVYDVEVVTTGSVSNVYTVSQAMPLNNGSTLARFNRDTGTGDLTFQSCLRDNEATGVGETSCTAVNGILNATSITARPDGEFLYVTGNDDNAIAWFQRNTGDGTISQYAGANDKCTSDGDNECGTDDETGGLGGVNETAVAPDGRFLYSTADGDDAVAEFAIQFAPVCQPVTRNDVPAQTTVDIAPDCSDLNEPRDVLTIEVRSQPPAGEGTVTAEDTNGDGRADTLRYNPGNFVGTTSFTYGASDDQGNASPAATVTVTVHPAGAPVISIADAAQDEGDTGDSNTMVFTLTRGGPTTSAIAVTYTVQEDTATEPEDYTNPSPMTVNFAAGETTKTISVPIVGDEIDELAERFQITLTNATAASGPEAAIGDGIGIGTIADDDTSVINAGNDTVAEDGGPATVFVTLSTPSSRTVTVKFSTGSGTATAPSDFIAQSDVTVSFNPGETAKSVPVEIVDDTTVEPTEQFTVTLSDPTNGAQLGDPTGEVTILDDDDPSVSISDVGIAEGDSGTLNAVFAVTLSAPTASTVTVDWATSNGTATAGSDYDAAGGTVTFAAGETTKTVSVPIRGDTTEEADETFTVTLSNPSNATIGDGSGTGTIQNDDRAPAETPPTPPTPPAPPAPPARTTIVVGDTGLAEGDRGTRNATFTVALSQAATSAIGVDITTANGTAVGGSDYRAASGRLTFAPGETTKTFAVPVIGDAQPELDETFVVRLANATGADIAKASGVGTIANDDIRRRLPGLSFTVTPRRDLTLPHVFRVRGRVILPTGLTAAEACGIGTVAVQYKNGGNTISTRRVVIDRQCRFTLRTPFNVRDRLRNARRLKVVVRFLGNRYLSSRTARSVFVRVR